MNEKILSLCEKAQSIMIYGAGTTANVLYLYLQSNGLAEKIRCFVVTELEGNPRSRYGIEVLVAENAVRLYKDSVMILAVQEVVQSVISCYLQELGFYDFHCIDGGSLINELYQKLYSNPIQKNKIVFSNMKNMGYGGNPKYIAEKLLECVGRERLDLVWVVSGNRYCFPKGIRTVEFGTYEYYYELATARIWIDNTRKNFDSRKRQGQYYIQTWHGAAPIKKVEKDAEHVLPAFYIVNAKRDSQMADLFLSGSRFYTQLYRRSFWYDGSIMEVGLPRQDIFWHKSKARRRVFEYFQIDESFAMVLYAPTFRKDFTGKYYDLDLIAVKEALEVRFEKKFIFAISKHPDNRYLEYKFEHENYIAVDGYEDFEEILAAADVLITDYSGCMYDFSYTRRPVFLYQKDYELYQLDRDFYVPMDELPYARTCSNEGLIHCIQEFDEESYLNKLDAFMNSMGNFDNGTASEKVVEHIRKVLERQ